MEAIEEFTGSNDQTVIVKGKRTKRLRPLSLMSSSSSSGGGGGGVGGYSTPSPTSSGDFSTTTEEEEDMANCLILLAQGVRPMQQVEKKPKCDKLNNYQPGLAATSNIFVYECKTCNRTFPSFQALGGHRASHKKPKAIVSEEKKLANSVEEGHFIKISTPLSLQFTNKPSHQQQQQQQQQQQHHHMVSNNNKAKVHECSICGAEFSSGQALGGHMRRHRTHTNNRSDTNTIDHESHEEHREKPIRHVLSLDLNLPAPEDDHRDSKFEFASNQQHLVFSSPALVDCHY